MEEEPNTMSPVLENVVKASCEASSHLVWWRCRPEKALEILTPLHSLEIPEGVEKNQYDTVMSLVMVVTADCYVIMKEPIKAAEWYRKATQYHKGGSYSFAYAKIVLINNLSSHYQTALESMKAEDANWSELPVLIKLFACIFYRWWRHPRLWCLPFVGRTYARRLQDRIIVRRIS